MATRSPSLRGGGAAALARPPVGTRRAAGTGRRRRRGVETLTVIAAFVRRDWTLARSYKLPFAVEIFQSLVSLVMVFYLSRLVHPSLAGEGAAALRAGYFPFAVVGLGLLTILTVALITFAARLRTDQTTGTLEALMATPTSPSLIILASASYELLYSTVSAALMFVLAIGIFGLRFDVKPLGIPLLVVALVASVLVFAAVGVAFAAFIIVFKKGGSLLTFGGGALSLLGGVYFPVSLLPGPVAAVARALPLTQAANIFRDILLFGKVPYLATGYLALSAVVLLPLGLWIFESAIRRSRRAGTLGQY
ncbi:MAG TPA: ABC transporter permease [Acidimicrobiales bacterium]|nr:ABC transporter permease [Acidimicrobiales bacterium]